MGINYLLALIGGVGLTLIVMTLLEKPQSKAANMLSLTLDDRVLDAEPVQKATWRDRLQTMLYQTGSPISVSEFLTVSLVIGILASGAIFISTQALLLSIIVFFGGAFVYFLFLMYKRDRAIGEYESVQTQVIYTILFYLQAQGLDLYGALEHLASSGPEIARVDWQGIAAAFSSGEPDLERIQKILTFRNSPSLVRLVESILLYRDRDIAELPKVLEDLRQDVSADVEIARENASTLTNAKQQLSIVCILPILLSFFFLTTSPMYGKFYRTVLGQMLMVGCWVIVGTVYLIGTRAAAKASMTRPYDMMIAEKRAATSYKPTQEFKIESDIFPADKPAHSVSSPQINGTNDLPGAPETRNVYRPGRPSNGVQGGSSSRGDDGFGQVQNMFNKGKR